MVSWGVIFILSLVILIYIVSLTLISLGLFAIKVDHKSKTNQFFFFTTFFFALWIISNALSNSLTEYNYVLWTNKAIFLSTSLLIFFLYLFSLSYPNKNLDFTLGNKLLLSSALVSTLFISSSNYVVKDVKTLDGISEIEFGVGVYWYLLFFITFFALFLKEIIVKFHKSKGLDHEKIRFLVIGFLLTALGASITNLVLPVFFMYYRLSNIGPAFSLIFVLFITIAIVKHQLFDIRLLFGKTLYYLIASIPSYFTYFALAFIYESIYQTSFNRVAYIIGIPTAILFTAFVNLFTKFISEYTESHLINPGYSPLVVLEQLRQRLSTSLDVEKIIQESLFIIARTIRPESSGVILITNDQTNTLISYNYKKDPFPRPQDFNMFLQFFITRSIKSITANELKSSERWLDMDQVLVSHLLTQMTKFKVEVILPLKEEQKIRGLLLVGFKEAQAPYNAQEIKLLYSISETMTLGIGRALSYKEIQQFNETLQKKVTDATTELQQKNKTLEEALLKLEEVRRQEKDMLDVMGHELRTPISIARNAVIALQKLFDRNDLNPEKNRKYTNMAVESIRREIALIETFLSTTKLEGGRMQMNLEPVSLVKVVEDSLIAHQDLSKRNKTVLSFERPEQDIIVQADKIRIQEVADNFVNNAIKYTGEGSVELSIYENEGLGWIDVKDDGIGISPENLVKLGRKFFRAQTLYNKSNNVVNPSGTGLGLFVSFQLIDLMKGKKKILSEEGKGSTFSFGLPLYPGSNTAPNDKPEKAK